MTGLTDPRELSRLRTTGAVVWTAYPAAPALRPGRPTPGLPPGRTPSTPGCSCRRTELRAAQHDLRRSWSSDTVLRPAPLAYQRRLESSAPHWRPGRATSETPGW